MGRQRSRKFSGACYRGMVDRTACATPSSGLQSTWITAALRGYNPPMTTINTLDDFLQALDANPAWREAVRARILGDELLQLPVRFEAFVQEQKAFNQEQKDFTLSNDDLNRMAGSSLERDVLRSFRNADLVIEAADGTDTRFIAMEISFTADQRDCSRAIRNADLITRFTGKPARAAIASVRNHQAAATTVESGAVHWHPMEDRTPDPE